jgi:NitT/TauT family transport system ATP-binding protein
MELIKVDGICYRIAGETIIDGLSFGAGRNEFVSIIGPSGCGKSTLLRIIAGLIKPTSGRVLFNGRKINRPRREISFVFQDFALLPWLTNRENVALGLSSLRLGEEDKWRIAGEMLKEFGIGEFVDSYPNALSGGMKQRVGLARALAQKPEVLLMDEPFSALDELTANSMRREVLERLRKRGTSVKLVVMVTHNVEEAVLMSDRVVILSDKPTTLKGTRTIRMGRARDRKSSAFGAAVDEIYAKLAEDAPNPGR